MPRSPLGRAKELLLSQSLQTKSTRANGRCVAFDGDATKPSRSDVFVHDLVAGTTEIANAVVLRIE